MEPIRALIRADFTIPLSVNEICRITGLSPFTVCNSLAKAVRDNALTQVPELYRWPGTVSKFCTDPPPWPKVHVVGTDLTIEHEPEYVDTAEPASTIPRYCPTISVEDAANREKLPLSMIQAWVREGLIRTTEDGLIVLASLYEYLDQRRATA